MKPSVTSFKMFKFLSIALLVTFSFQQNFATIIRNENVLILLHEPVNTAPGLSEISSKWEQHIMDFVNLIDIDKVLAVVMGYVSDPEVLNFISFIISDDFNRVVWDFESLAEFKEAFKLLADKGYNVNTVIDFINNALDLPPFEQPKVNTARNGKGMTGLIEDLIAVLPMDEIKALFESKLETSPEVAELFETINSPEFMDIMRRMSQNPEFEKIKEIFKGYGFDFERLCQLAKDVFGEYYQGVFCEN